MTSEKLLDGDAVRWGILGTGRMATQFAEALEQVEGAQLAAVGSRTRETAEEFGSRHRVPHQVVGYETLVERSDIDVVYVATPHTLHRDNALLCLQAGKAVLCEKPFAINAAQAREVIDAARRHKLFLMEGMWTRYIPAVVRLRQLLHEGAIGEVRMIIAGGGFIPEFDPDFYLFDPAMGGGVLLDAGVYLVSLACMIAGSPTRIMALGQLGDRGIDEHDAMLLEHRGGALSNLYVSLRTRASPDVTLLGSEGSIYVHPPLFCPKRLTVTTPDNGTEQLDFPFPGSGYQFQAMEVGRCLRAGRLESEVMPLEETLSIMQTLDAIRAQIGLRYPGE